MRHSPPVTLGYPANLFSGPGVLNLGGNHKVELSSWEGVAGEKLHQRLVESSHSARGGKRNTTFPL